MSINMKTLTQALAKTANVIEKTIQTTVNEVTGPRALQDYTILHQIGSGGPANIWKLYSARPSTSAPSTQYPLVCVWILDKKSLSESRIKAGLSKAAEDGFLDVVRADVGRMVRIRHPGVVHVVSGLDEGKNSMVVVTEPLFASVGNALGYLHNIENVPKELKGMEMGLLEVKHGLLQVAETLDFLHSNARLVHRSISPETVFITSSGAWKLGGFGFAITVDEASSASMQPFHYPEYDVEDEILPLQPLLNYTAPELVKSKLQVAGSSSDVFSFGCLAYHLIARKPLLDCHNNVKMYMNTLAYLSSDAFSMIPSELIGDLQRMLSMDAASRPTAMDFTGSSFFRNDSRLRALRFLDHMLERDNMQKSEFLKALSDMWKDFDSRVLRYKVLPPLCAELRNLVMQPMILPMVLTIAESQDKSEFELATLPALVPVLTSASGDTLLLLVKHADLIINKASQDHLITHVLPMLVRAYDDSDARMQEEVLRRTVPLARQLDMQLVKQAILPRVHSLALRTTVAAVRVNALRCLGDLVSSLDKHAILEILQTIQRCTAVDRSAPTLMCTLGVANAIFKQCGVEFTSEHVLPLLFPLLTSQQLNVQQFSKYMLFVRDTLRKIEEKRGVTITDAHVEIKPTPAPSLSNGLHSEPVHRASMADSSSTKSNKSWDEDWGTITKGTPAAPVPINSIQPQPIQSSPPSLVTTSSSTSCAPVDIEWPPSSVSSNTNINHFNLEDKSKQSLDFTSNSSSSFDDLDPFANWPPKPSTTTTSGASMNNFNFTSNISTPMNTTNMRSTQSNPSSNSMVGGMRYPNTMNNTSRKGGDIGSVFSSSTNGGNPAPRLAPPPSSAISRGAPVGGRGAPMGGRGRGTRSNNNAKASNQPPLLDLL